MSYAPDAGWAFFALLIFFLALAPGYILARVFRVHGLQAIAAAPSLTFGMVGAASMVAGWLHIRWGTLTALGLILAQLLVLFTARQLVRRYGKRSIPTAHARDSEALPKPAKIALPITSVLAVGLVLSQFSRGLARPTDPSQFWDGMFHLNALKVIELHGNASPLGGLKPISLDGKVNFYPTLYHALVTIATTKSTPLGLAISASAAALVALGVITLTGLTHSLLTYSAHTPAKQLTIVLTPLLAAGSLCLTQLATVLSTLPYLAAMTAIPGALGALNIAATRGTHWGFRVMAVLGCMGVFISHPIGGFSLILLALPLIFGKALPLLRRRKNVFSPGQYRLIWAGLAGILIAGLAAFVGPMFRVVSYYREATPATKLLLSLVSDWPTMRRAIGGASLYSVTIALALIGCTWLVVNRINHWIVASTALTCGFYFLCSQGTGPLRRLASPWYMQPERLQVAFSIALVATAAIGIYAIATWACHRGAASKMMLSLAIFCVALTPFSRAGDRAELVSLSYDPMRIGWGTFATRTEMASFPQIKRITRDDVIISIPDSGLGYGYALANVNSYYRQAYSIGQTEFELFRHLRKLDAESCKFLRERHIKYYYRDTDRTASGATHGAKHSKKGARLDRVPINRMTLVWKAASAPSGEGPRLYRIDACY